MTTRARATLVAVTVAAWVAGWAYAGAAWILYSGAGVASIAAALYLDHQLRHHHRPPPARPAHPDYPGDRRRTARRRTDRHPAG